MRWLSMAAVAACSSEPAVPAPTQLTDRPAASLWVVGSTLYLYDTYNDTDVWAVPIDGSAPPQRRFATGAQSLVAFGSDHIYYTTANADGSKNVTSEPLAGGSATVLAPSVPVSALAASDQGVLLFGGRITFVPDGGGSAVDLGAGAPVASLAADSGYAYWIEYDLRLCNRIALDGTRPLHIACMGNTQIVPRGDVAYIRYNCPQDGACGAVSSLDFPTNEARTLAMPDHVKTIAVDDAHVYWVEPHRIMRADLDGHSQVPLARTPQDVDIQTMAVDATSIYYSTSELSSNTLAYGIWSAPK